MSTAEDRNPRSVFIATMDMLTSAAGKSRWAEKTPGNVFFANVLLDMFPEAKFVFVKRDPRAVVASMNRVRFYPADSVVNALNVKHYLKWIRRAEQSLPSASCKTLQYEDLLASPGKILPELCCFLELPYEPEMLLFYDNSKKTMDPNAVSNFNRLAAGPLDSRNANRWRETLPADEQAIIQYVLRRELTEEGTAVSTVNGVSLFQRFVCATKAGYWWINRMRKIRSRAFQQRDIHLYRTRRQAALILRRLGLPVALPFAKGRPPLPPDDNLSVSHQPPEVR